MSFMMFKLDSQVNCKPSSFKHWNTYLCCVIFMIFTATAWAQSTDSTSPATLKHYWFQGESSAVTSVPDTQALHQTLNGVTLRCGQSLDLWFQIETRSFDALLDNLDRARFDLSWHVHVDESHLNNSGVSLLAHGDAYILPFSQQGAEIQQRNIGDVNANQNESDSIAQHYILSHVAPLKHIWIAQPLQVHCQAYSASRGTLQVITSSTHLHPMNVSVNGDVLSHASTVNMSQPLALSIQETERIQGVNAPLIDLQVGLRLVDGTESISGDTGSQEQEDCVDLALQSSLSLVDLSINRVHYCYTMRNLGTQDVHNIELGHHIQSTEVVNEDRTDGEMDGEDSMAEEMADEEIRDEDHTGTEITTESSATHLEESNRVQRTMIEASRQQSLLAGEQRSYHQVEAIEYSQWVHAVLTGQRTNGASNESYTARTKSFVVLPTNAALDSDADGLSDVDEFHYGTNAQVIDSDEDGLSDGDEVLIWHSNPIDADSDDDGVLDGDEIAWMELFNTDDLDPDGDGLLSILDADSDNDTLPDGLEVGVTIPHVDTDQSLGLFIADADPVSTSNPLSQDSDNGGCLDHHEDLNGNGKVDLGESNPALGIDRDDIDSDADGLCDPLEKLYGLEVRDQDSDDDGLVDGDEVNALQDTDGDGIINALDPDSDNDGLFDGTERGMIIPMPDTDLAVGVFIADMDPNTLTDMLNPDSDGGGVIDGAEDFNRNGKVDQQETNPLHSYDDIADIDQDRIANHRDNCPLESNSAQLDDDNDQIGNACDLDIDNDGTLEGTSAANRGCQSIAGLRSTPWSSTALILLSLLLMALNLYRRRLHHIQQG
jgi:hypothetical protein